MTKTNQGEHRQANLNIIPTARLLKLIGIGLVLSIVFLSWPGGYMALLALNLLLLLMAFLDWFLTPGIRCIDLERRVNPRLSLLQPATVNVVVHNKSRSALLVRWRDTVPLSFELTSENKADGTGKVEAAGSLVSSFTVMPRKRGMYTFEDMHLRYRSLLGLWERLVVKQLRMEARVYPSVADVERYHLLLRANRLDLIGLRQLRIKGSAEFESLRDYQRGDDIRLLDWKATARRSKLIVRNQQAERNQTLIIMLDSGRLMNAEENGVSKLDLAINATLLLTHVALSRGDRIGLCVFSHRVHAWVTPRSSPHQLQLISDAMYNLQGDFTESIHSRALGNISTRFNKRALLIMMTDFVDAATSSEMFAHLQQSSRKHLILFAALKDRYLIEASRRHSEKRRDGFQQATAINLLHERRLVLEQLRRSGVQVIDAAPEDLAPHLLNKYLEITYRGLL